MNNVATQYEGFKRGVSTGKDDTGKDDFILNSVLNAPALYPPIRKRRR